MADLMHATPPDVAPLSPVCRTVLPWDIPPARPFPMRWWNRTGRLRPQWQSFVSMLDELGPEELKLRWEHAQRLIHDNGVSHNVYGDPQGLDRPWSLDSVPLLIRANEWDKACAGLSQRARLLDRLLADLYGPMRTLYERILPPELVWANPGFLRPVTALSHLLADGFISTPRIWFVRPMANSKS